MNKIVILKNDPLSKLSMALPRPNTGTANKALKEAGFNIKELGSIVDLFFLIDDIGNCYQYRLEKKVNPNNGATYVYVTEKQLVVVKKDANGCFIALNDGELEKWRVSIKHWNEITAPSRAILNRVFGNIISN